MNTGDHRRRGSSSPAKKTGRLQDLIGLPQVPVLPLQLPDPGLLPRAGTRLIPASTMACWTQRRSDSNPTPTFGPTALPARYGLSYSSRWPTPSAPHDPTAACILLRHDVDPLAKDRYRTRDDSADQQCRQDVGSSLRHRRQTGDEADAGACMVALDPDHCGVRRDQHGASTTIISSESQRYLSPRPAS